MLLENENRSLLLAESSDGAPRLSVDRITKDFYRKIQSQHAALAQTIEGIDNDDQRHWYASLLINRMMFLYFIQKAGFLDGDQNYLQNRLSHAQQTRLSFYRDLLLRLFHDGLNKAEADRDPRRGHLLRSVPLLGRRIFGIHPIENENPNIKIPNAAFQRLLDFFDQYRWSSTEQPPREKNDINPDVLAYVLEKHVNQKQMGAYYTKPDITAYITNNTIVPRVLTAAAKQRPQLFEPGGKFWRMLGRRPNRYIHQAVGHGIFVNIHRQQELTDPVPAVRPTSELELDSIAPPAIALPGETWRECLARRRRCEDLQHQLAARQLSDIDDLITSNLDLLRVIGDLVDRCDDAGVLRAVYFSIAGGDAHGVKQLPLTVLDPTCGSGAFLFAALKVLVLLYDKCLDKMDRLAEQHADFRAVLDDVARYPNRRFAVFHAIINNNLYGVDIMPEAVEICQLRLLLALLSSVAPDPDRDNMGLGNLPNLDTNIRCGNALTGDVQRPQQDAEKDFQFADRENGPLHWWHAFPNVMAAGGFDVVIGNPPYISAAKIDDHDGLNLKTGRCGDIYAWCLERAAELCGSDGRTGMIVPLSLTFSRDFATLRELLFDRYSRNWFSSFGRIPSALFAHDVRVRNCIHLGSKSKQPTGNFTSRLHRWFDQDRKFLFPLLGYAEFQPAIWNHFIPKADSPQLLEALQSLRWRDPRSVSDHLVSRKRPTEYPLYFKKTAYNWLAFSDTPPPSFAADGSSIEQTQLDCLYIDQQETHSQLLLLLNGKLAFAFWVILGDDFHVTKHVLAGIPAQLSALSPQDTRQLNQLAAQLRQAMNEAVTYKLNAGKKVGSYNLVRCREITDRSDQIFLKTLGLESCWDEIQLLCSQTVKTEFQ